MRKKNPKKNPRKKNPYGSDSLGKKITKEQIEATRWRNGPGSLNMVPDPVSALHAEKMLKLLAHYGIDFESPDCWLQLSYALACKHEPGFQVEEEKGTAGAPIIYDEAFVRAVEEKRKDLALAGKKVSNKAAFVAMQAEGKYPGNLKALERGLSEAKTRLEAKAKLDAENAKREAAVQASSEAFWREAKETLAALHRKKPRK
jgi:hypothetical protein